MGKAKAKLVVDIESKPIGPTTQYYLVLQNKGDGEARGISMRLDGIPISAHPAFNSRLEERGHLDPHSSFRYPLALHDHLPKPFEVDITWVDDSGEPGRCRKTLTWAD